jgi:hypothetical protein
MPFQYVPISRILPPATSTAVRVIFTPLTTEMKKLRLSILKGDADEATCELVLQRGGCHWA